MDFNVKVYYTHMCTCVCAHVCIRMQVYVCLFFFIFVFVLMLAHTYCSYISSIHMMIVGSLVNVPVIPYVYIFSLSTSLSTCQ